MWQSSRRKTIKAGWYSRITPSQDYDQYIQAKAKIPEVLHGQIKSFWTKSNEKRRTAEFDRNEWNKQLGVICKLSEGAFYLTANVIDEDTKEHLSQYLLKKRCQSLWRTPFITNLHPDIDHPLWLQSHKLFLIHWTVHSSNLYLPNLEWKMLWATCVKGQMADSSGLHWWSYAITEGQTLSCTGRTCSCWSNAVYPITCSSLPHALA